jgi:hypothetical protein
MVAGVTNAALVVNDFGYQATFESNNYRLGGRKTLISKTVKKLSFATYVFSKFSTLGRQYFIDKVTWPLIS